ncbi:MAG: hypothetical protein Q8O68_01160, partial [Candidatus Daviesbacteria bacterium]|nr:hypothetical protein [Candidatus Daviesbacteria bacterium]
DHLDTIKLYKIHLKKRFRLPISNMSHEDVEGWEETMDIMSNKKLVKSIRRGIADFKAGRFISENQLLKDLRLTKKDITSPGSV